MTKRSSSRPNSADLRTKLQLVREARAIFGVSAARLLWAELGLPDLPVDPDPMPKPPSSNAEILQRFLADAVAPKRGSRVGAMALHQAFEAWAVANGEAPWTIKRFALEMKALGYRSLVSNTRWWLEIALIADTEAARGHSGKAGCTGVSVLGKVPA